MFLFFSLNKSQQDLKNPTVIPSSLPPPHQSNVTREKEKKRKKGKKKKEKRKAPNISRSIISLKKLNRELNNDLREC